MGGGRGLRAGAKPQGCALTQAPPPAAKLESIDRTHHLLGPLVKGPQKCSVIVDSLSGVLTDPVSKVNLKWKLQSPKHHRKNGFCRETFSHLGSFRPLAVKMLS